MKRWQLLVMAAAATAAVTVPAVQNAAAEIDGPCAATLDGIDISTRSSTSADDAIRVGEHDVIDIVVESTESIDRYEVQLTFAGFAWTVASDEANGTSWRRSVEVDDYSRFGVGLYRVRAVSTGTTPNPLDMDYPTIEEGVAGMAFIEAVVASSANNAAWTPLDYTPTTRAKYGDATLSSDRGGLA